ncbi:MAG: metabolite traffic protein EboE [Planctomycetaceae bacterium]
MSLSTLPLSYCTNVHPGLTVDEVIEGLTRFTAPTQQQLGSSIAAGLWLAAPVISQVRQNPEELNKLATALQKHGLVCYTLNAFPYGDFHSERVKEQVYIPDWTTEERLSYSKDCAAVLAELLPDGTEGSISTVPLGFKELATAADFIPRCIDRLLTLATALDDLHDDTGRVIRLAIEPEPLCVLETTAETLAFFQQLFEAAEQQGLLYVAQRHLGVCYDVCHQAVEFEDVPASIQSLQEAGIRINKLHITCAIHILQPGENPAAREYLAAFVEPRYLHQTFARSSAGGVVSLTDLTRELCLEPFGDFATAEAWRVHYHVPVNAEQVGPLHTTRPEMRQALQAVAQLDYAPHLEVETYTWGVLPDGEKPNLVDGLTGELRATLDELARCQGK